MTDHIKQASDWAATALEESDVIDAENHDLKAKLAAAESKLSSAEERAAKWAGLAGEECSRADRLQSQLETCRKALQDIADGRIHGEFADSGDMMAPARESLK